MSLESFFHEVALRQASADRDNIKFSPPWWKRWLDALPVAAKRSLVVGAIAAVAAAGWWLRAPLHRYLLSASPHSPGAADVLATVAHRASPAERAFRLALACARENNARACQEALRHALTVVEPPVVVSWLKEKEIHALRVNAFFDRFAVGLENPSHSAPPVTAPVAASAQVAPPSKRETRPFQTGIAADAPPLSSSGRAESLRTFPQASNRGMDYLLGPSTSATMGDQPAPQTFLDVSIARSANPTDRVNEPPIKKKSYKDDPTR
jgi:hypothetical protein